MIKNPQWCKYLHLGFVGFLGWLGVTIFIPETYAQSKIVSDNTLSTESSQIILNFNGLPVEVVTGGATRGINLFHSFQEFNVSDGRGAYFFVPSATIQNVLARVTGNHPSEILGTLGTFGRSLNINNGSSIQAIATEGNSGAINIVADETVSLTGREIGSTTATLLPSTIISNVISIDASTGNSVIKPTSGTSGGVNIKAQNLALADDNLIVHKIQ